MNNQNTGQVSINSFRIWDYPAFALSLGYIWMEMTNPLIGFSFQIIPKIPNAAIALIVCYRFMPDFLKYIQVPFNPVKWTLPFLIIATINLPFIEHQRWRSVIELASTWYWVLFLLPLMMRVMATPAGRWHFTIFSTISVVYLASIYFIGLTTGQFDRDGFYITYHHLTPGVILTTPLIIGYITQKSGLTRYFLIASLLLVMAAAVPAGARSIWLFVPLELLLLIIFVLPKSRLIIAGITGMIAFYSIFSLVDVTAYYSETTLDHLDVRMRKTIEWQKDNTIWRRIGMFKKAEMILSESPFLGIGYSNRSFASYDAGDVEIMGRVSYIGKYDAHNTYLNIFVGTGFLGFIAFLYYFKKVGQLAFSIPFGLWKRIDIGSFMVSMIGSLVWYFVNTNPFTSIVYQTTFVMAIYVHIHNFRLSQESLEE